MRYYFHKIFILLALVSSLLALSGCGNDARENVAADAAAITVYDSLGRKITLDAPLTRVAIANAYNTDLTELVSALGCLDTIVGVDQNILWNTDAFHHKFTKEQLICAREGLAINYEKVVELKPQALLISSKGSWYDAQEKLANFGIKVIVIDTHNLEQFGANCDLLGKIFGKEARAREIKEYFGGQLAYVQKQLANISPRKTVYFECGGPGATTMPGSYFYSLVQDTGGINIMEDAVERHIVPEAVVLRNPQYIVKMADRRWKYSYQPPTEEEHLLIKQDLLQRPGWDEIDAVKHDRFFQLSYFSHCGASKIIGVLYVAKFLYPEYLPDLHPEAVFKVWLTKYLGLDYVAGHTYPAMSLDY